jgi:hypothetical protein
MKIQPPPNQNRKSKNKRKIKFQPIPKPLLTQETKLLTR